LTAKEIRVFGCWDTHFSKLGLGVAALCATQPGLRAIVSYPVSKKRDIPQAIVEAERLGAMLLPVPSNHVAICYAQARKRIEALGARSIVGRDRSALGGINGYSKINYVMASACWGRFLQMSAQVCHYAHLRQDSERLQ
jgi:hypothetical protein